RKDGKEDCRQDGDDGYYDKQLDERKGSFVAHSLFLRSFVTNNAPHPPSGPLSIKSGWRGACGDPSILPVPSPSAFDGEGSRRGGEAPGVPNTFLARGWSERRRCDRLRSLRTARRGRRLFFLMAAAREKQGGEQQ